MNRDRLKRQLRIDEGYKKKPYKDSVGKTTIGVGRNLDDIGVGDDEIQLMLENDISHAYGQLVANLPWFKNLDDVRQEVLTNMCFNMGWSTLSTFKNTLHYFEVGNWIAAKENMIKSKWHEQVGVRAERLEYATLYGQFEVEP